PDLKIGDETGAATPQQVKEVIAALLDDGPPAAGMREGLLAERMSLLDTARCLLNGKLKPDGLLTSVGRKSETMPVGMFVRAAANDGVLLMQHSDAVIHAFESSPDWPTYKQRDPGRPGELDANPGQHPLAMIMFSPLDRAIETHFRGATDRRLAAVVLAGRAYAAAHGGKMPEKLDSLVSDYLPSVPDDPMAVAQPIKYLPDLDRPIVYSVGTNGSDDAGTETADPN